MINNDILSLHCNYQTVFYSNNCIFRWGRILWVEKLLHTQDNKIFDPQNSALFIPMMAEFWGSKIEGRISATYTLFMSLTLSLSSSPRAL